MNISVLSCAEQELPMLLTTIMSSALVSDMNLQQK